MLHEYIYKVVLQIGVYPSKLCPRVKNAPVSANPFDFYWER